MVARASASATADGASAPHRWFRPPSLPPGWWLGLAALLLTAGVIFAIQLVQEVSSAPSVSGHHDFLAFHAAAQLVRDGSAGQLYDSAALAHLERQVINAPVGAAGYMPFINPPFAAAVQAPLGLLDEPTARVIWLLMNAPLAALCCWLATAGLQRRARLLAAACLLGSFPTFQALVEGQWSFVMLTGCLAALAAARSGRSVLSGACLAVLALKPPLLIPVLAVMLLTRSWRALGGTLGAAALAWLVTLPFTGWSTQLDYAGYLVGVLGSHLDGAGAAGGAVWHGGIAAMEGLNGLAAGYVGQQNALVVDGLTAVAVIAVVAWWGRAVATAGWMPATARGRWLVVAGIVAMLLTDLHLFPQDCVLLLVALPLVLAETASAHRLATVLGVALVLDASWLDQLTITPHVFTWLLVAGFLFACRMAALAGSVRPAPALVPTVSPAVGR